MKARERRRALVRAASAAGWESREVGRRVTFRGEESAHLHVVEREHSLGNRKVRPPGGHHDAPAGAGSAMDDGDRMFGTNAGVVAPAESRDGRRAPDERRAKHRVFLPGNQKKKPLLQKSVGRGSELAPETALIERARARAVSEEVRYDFRRGARGVFASPVGRAFGARDVYFEDGEGASTTEVSPPSRDILKKRKLVRDGQNRGQFAGIFRMRNSQDLELQFCPLWWCRLTVPLEELQKLEQSQR